MTFTEEQYNWLAEQSYWVDKEKMMLNIIQKKENSIILFFILFQNPNPLRRDKIDIEATKHT
ncbi:TPA: hypothetical protein TYI97_000630 [Streptococcus suis]|nr:hypothetical protein [Streptococcus suis]